MKHLKFLFLIIAIVAIITLLVQNHEAFATKVVFKVNILIKQYQTPEINIYLISLIAFILGVIITWVYGIMERFHLKRQIQSLMSETREKDKELNSLRNLPITTDNMLPMTQDDNNDMEMT
jgi:uncharacterized membrane protein YciS (DUF1049 family)